MLHCSRLLSLLQNCYHILCTDASFVELQCSALTSWQLGTWAFALAAFPLVRHAGGEQHGDGLAEGRAEAAISQSADHTNPPVHLLLAAVAV